MCPTGIRSSLSGYPHHLNLYLTERKTHDRIEKIEEQMNINFCVASSVSSVKHCFEVVAKLKDSKDSVH
jgi:hypothetical protein